MLQLKVQGTLYDFDDNKLSVIEARQIKEHAGLGIADWGKGLRDGDPDALVAMVFLAKKRAGEAVKWRDLDNLDLMSDLEWPEEAEGDDGEDADEVKPDPTPLAAKRAAKKSTAGRTQKRG